MLRLPLARYVLVAFALLFAGDARAGLTSPVAGLADAFYGLRSQGDTACAALDDAIADRGPGDVVLRLADGSRLWLRSGPSDDHVCREAGWAVRAPENRTCAERLCGLLARPVTGEALGRSLDAALQRAGRDYPMEQMPRPVERAAVVVDLWSVVWLIAALAALFGAIGLSLGRSPETRERGAANALPPQLWWAGLAACVAAALGLRMWLASALPFYTDELSSWGLTSLWQELGNPDARVNPPLYRILAWPVAALTGGDVNAGRAVASTLGAATVASVGVLGRRLGGGAAGLVAAALAALHPGMALLGMFHRAYAALLFFSTLLLWSTTRALDSDQSRDRYAAACFAVCVVLCHWFGLLFVAGVALWMLAHPRRGALQRWHGPAEVAVVLFLPFVPLLLGGGGDKLGAVSQVVGSAHMADVGRALIPVVTGQWAPELQGSIGAVVPSTSLWTGTALGVAAIGFAVWFCRRDRPVARLWWVAAGVGGVVVVAASRVTGVREAQAMAAAIPLLILAGVALTQARAPRGRLLSAAVGLVLVGGLGSVSVARGRNVPADEPHQLLAAHMRAQPAQRPMHVWAWDDFHRAGIAWGVSAANVFRSYEGSDPDLRALRSCSTAAVREALAAQVDQDAPVWVAVMPDGHVWAEDDPLRVRCDADRLSGRGVSCEAETGLGADATVFRCDVQ